MRKWIVMVVLALGTTLVAPVPAGSSVQTPTGGSGSGNQGFAIVFRCTTKGGEDFYQFTADLAGTYKPGAGVVMDALSYHYETTATPPVPGKNDLVITFEGTSSSTIVYDTRDKDNESYAVPYSEAFVGNESTPGFIKVHAIFDRRGDTDPTCDDTTTVFT